MLSYLFGRVSGTALTTEPALFAMLVVFGVGLLVGVALWLLSRRFRGSNPLAARQTRRLGIWLFGVSAFALTVAGFFSQDALFTRRFWLYLMLLLLYAVIGYALYFYFTSYPRLERQQQVEREKRRKYIPAPHTLAKGGGAGRSRSSRGKRRR